MTKIEWTDATWNPLAGCSLVSPGCTNCYAMGFAARLLDQPGSHYEGTTKRVNGKAVWTGNVTRAPDHIITQPLRWTRPRMVFVNSMSDLFHESVPDEWIDDVFAVMALCPQHTFQILTKRPDRMMEYCKTLGKHHSVDRVAKAAKKMGDERKHPVNWFYKLTNTGWALENVWLGVSVEDQRRANERIPVLLDTPAAVRFLSIEPLIGGIDLNGLARPAKKDPDKVPMVKETALYTAADRPAILPAHDLNKIDWVIVGGESGPGARPMHPDWVRYLRDQCITAGVRFFFKQWGHWAEPGPEDEYDTLKGRAGSPPAFLVDLNGNVHCSRNAAGDEAVVMLGKGKKKAGRMLDGTEWNQMPGGL